MLIQLVAQILVCLPPKCHKTSKIKGKKRCWQWVWYLVTSSLYKIICFVDNKMGLLKLYLCNHSLMANLLILSNLIKHSCTFTKKHHYLGCFKKLFQWWFPWRILTIRHDPKELLAICSSSPYSTVTDSVQTIKQKNCWKNLLQIFYQGSTDLLKLKAVGTSFSESNFRNMYVSKIFFNIFCSPDYLKCHLHLFCCFFR